MLAIQRNLFRIVLNCRYLTTTPFLKNSSGRGDDDDSNIDREKQIDSRCLPKQQEPSTKYINCSAIEEDLKSIDRCHTKAEEIKVEVCWPKAEKSSSIDPCETEDVITASLEQYSSQSPEHKKNINLCDEVGGLKEISLGKIDPYPEVDICSSTPVKTSSDYISPFMKAPSFCENDGRHLEECKPKTEKKKTLGKCRPKVANKTTSNPCGALDICTPAPERVRIDCVREKPKKIDCEDANPFSGCKVMELCC